MPRVLVGGKPGFDGGLVDNVPVGPLEPVEAAAGRTLVLLTRTYRHVPKVPGRTYVHPSRPTGAKQFNITTPGAIRAAYELASRTARPPCQRAEPGRFGGCTALAFLLSHPLLPFR